MTSAENTRRKLTLSEAHAYWSHPNDGKNSPLAYLLDSEAHRLCNASLLAIFEKHVDRSDSILEIGCNAGRNLHTLWSAGFRRLSAVEISELSVDVMRRLLPNVYRGANVRIGAIEDVIKTIPKTRHDVIFTMAVLVHLPQESEWVFKEIAKRAKRRSSYSSMRRRTENLRAIFRVTTNAYSSCISDRR